MGQEFQWDPKPEIRNNFSGYFCLTEKPVFRFLGLCSLSGARGTQKPRRTRLADVAVSPAGRCCDRAAQRSSSGSHKSTGVRAEGTQETASVPTAHMPLTVSMCTCVHMSTCACMHRYVYTCACVQVHVCAVCECACVHGCTPIPGAPPLQPCALVSAASVTTDHGHAAFTAQKRVPRPFAWPHPAALLARVTGSVCRGPSRGPGASVPASLHFQSHSPWRGGPSSTCTPQARRPQRLVPGPGGARNQAACRLLGGVREQQGRGPAPATSFLFH